MLRCPVCTETGSRSQDGTRRCWQSCWRDDDSSESAGDVDCATSSSSSTWRSTSRCSSAAHTPSSSADATDDFSQSSPPSSLTDDKRSTDSAGRHQRSRSAVDRAYSPSERPTTASDATRRHYELSPSDDLLDFLQQRDRRLIAYDCNASANSCFEGRMGSFRRRRRSMVTPEFMHVDRERATGSPSGSSLTPSPSPQKTATPDLPPRTTQRRLLPQPDRAAVLEAAAATDAGKREADLRHSASPVCSRYFVPITKYQDEQNEGRTPSRRLPLVVDTNNDLASNVAMSTTAEPQDRQVLSAVGAVAAANVQENWLNDSAGPSQDESRHDNVEISASTTTSSLSRKQHRQQYATLSINKSLHNNDDNKLLDLPQDEQQQQRQFLSNKLTFQSLTLPQRWKCHQQNEESPKPLDGCRELWETCGDVTESRSTTSNSYNNPTATQSQLTSPSALSRVEAMKERFRRLSEMYKDSLEEDNAVCSKTKKLQNSTEAENQPVGETDNTETENGSKAASAWKTATSATSDTESLSSCGRDEGFESETATGSVVYGVDASCLESRLTADIITAVTPGDSTQETATICNEANFFTSSVDSVVQSSRSFSQIACADSSPSSTEEVTHCSGTVDNTVQSCAANRQSRISQQRAFADRMSAPRRSVTRSPQRRTPMSSSDATPRSGLYSSTMVRRRTRTPVVNEPRDLMPSDVDADHRRGSDAGEVDGTSTTSRFVRGSFTRTSLPHTGGYTRTSASARPITSKDQKQSVTSSPSLRRSYRSTSKTREGQTVKAATGWTPTPIAAYVDCNGVRTKSSTSARVFSTPVRFGATSHQTRPVQNTAAVTQSDDSSSSKQTDHDGHSHPGYSQQTNGDGPETTPAQKVSERKSVFERLFELAQRQRQSKLRTNDKPDTRQRSVIESHKKLSSKLPITSSINSARATPTC